MHMADALISPAVGGVLWVATAATMAYSVKKLKDEDIFESKKIPLMGVAGAFVFAAQMINFTIPATGSSGHLGGGLLLAALLGPYAGFLVMSVVLAIQALFFADGGLLALGCNIFNMGFLACFVAYPLIFQPLAARRWDKKSIFTASLIGAVGGLLMGAFGVVVQTTASGITELPFGVFSALMLPIHLAIGVVEGLVTAAVLVFVHTAQPSLLHPAGTAQASGRSWKKVLSGLAIAAVICAGCLSWFASSNPDGLEWSIFKATGATELETANSLHETLGEVQESTSFLPDYNFKNAEESESVVNVGGSVAGIVGSGMVLLLAALVGYLAVAAKKKNAPKHSPT